MCRNLIWRVGVSALGLLAAVALQGKTFAQSVGSNGGLIQQLRSAHKLLVEADHDYDGHRARRPKKFTRPSMNWKAITAARKPAPRL